MICKESVPWIANKQMETELKVTQFVQNLLSACDQKGISAQTVLNTIDHKRVAEAAAREIETLVVSKPGRVKESETRSVSAAVVTAESETQIPTKIVRIGLILLDADIAAVRLRVSKIAAKFPIAGLAQRANKSDDVFFVDLLGRLNDSQLSELSQLCKQISLPDKIRVEMSVSSA